MEVFDKYILAPSIPMGQVEPLYVKKRGEAQDNLEQRCGGAQDALKLLVLLEITYSESIDKIQSMLLKQKKVMNHLIT